MVVYIGSVREKRQDSRRSEASAPAVHRAVQVRPLLDHLLQQWDPWGVMLGSVGMLEDASLCFLCLARSAFEGHGMGQGREEDGIAALDHLSFRSVGSATWTAETVSKGGLVRWRRWCMMIGKKQCKC